MKIHFKKFLLSGAVILIFVFYSFYERSFGGSTVRANVMLPIIDLAGGAVNYKNGEYAGSLADAYYGNVRVKAVINGGKLTDVQFLDYPRDRQTSTIINNQANPLLRSEAIKAQSAQIDIVSGATETSQAFINSLSAALAQAAMK